MLCVAKNNSEYVEVTPVKVVKDNSLLNVIKGMNSYNVDTPEYHFELTADMFDENSSYIPEKKYFYNKNITKVETPSNITMIYTSAFEDCDNITNVILDRVTSIGQRAFGYCRKLTNINLGNSLDNIQSSAFVYCENLTSITIPNSVTSIGGNVFERCSKLTSINIPSGVTSIAYGLFYFCTELKSVVVGNITSISSYAFFSCINLQIVDFRAVTQVPTVQSNSFTNVKKSCKFIIPDELYDSWITATNWASLYANGYQFIKKSEYTEA